MMYARHTSRTPRRLATLLAIAWLLPAVALAAGDPAAGKVKAQACASCHGADGNASNPQFPRLAGQYESYLLQALRQYKSGQRKNAIMSGMVASLSEQDMKDLAAWFASQQGLYDTPAAEE